MWLYSYYSALYIYMYIVYIDCIDNCCNSTAILLIKFHVHRACHLETVKWIRLFMPCWNFEHVVIAFWSGDKYVHSYVSNSKWSSNHYSILYKILFNIRHSIRLQRNFKIYWIMMRSDIFNEKILSQGYFLLWPQIFATSSLRRPNNMIDHL